MRESSLISRRLKEGETATLLNLDMCFVREPSKLPMYIKAQEERIRERWPDEILLGREEARTQPTSSS